MDYRTVEKKWQTYWEKHGINKFDPKAKGEKYYVLEMFSYPSGSNLHLGHWYNFGLADSYARFMKMNGYNVFQPMGFDAFGLPAENYAIKTGIHPKDSTMKNIATMEVQLKAMGAMFDWDHELYTCAPEYYKWTQWLFLQLYKKGLAYQKLAPVNWCTSCNTVIANEQVVDGCCERCGTQIVRREMNQWFFKITEYAEELLDCLPRLDWPEKTKLMQKNWIGKSEGGEIEFDIEGGGSFRVFTTRADTLFGVSYVVLAPEHPLVDTITKPECRAAVEAYKAEAAKASDIERLSTSKEKTGVFTGAYCVNPLSGARVPIWIADYVLASYGSGAVMGVAAHDTRDYDFCVKHNLPIIRVIRSADGSPDDLPYTDYGVMVNSGEFDGLTTEAGKKAVLEKLASMGKGGVKVNYRLRDWSVSRQRYWGAPIPIIHCEHCGAVPVPEHDLPVELPYDVNFTPDGKSPLGKCESFMNVTCPVCGRPARRDPDTLDTFVCSSWYYLRYPDNKNAEKAFDPAVINRMLPVDKYVGGAEHACMHLLYSRFITKALRDMGYLDFDEPFTSLVHQGLILGADGEKMSKSKGNVVNPDTYVNEYGSDALRLGLMFGFRYSEGGPWSDDGMKAAAKFLDRLERLVDKCAAASDEKTPVGEKEKALDYALNHCIKCVSADMQTFSFNTAVARVMELVNAMYRYDADGGSGAYLKETAKTLVKIIAPMVPHTAEEFNERLGGKRSVFLEAYPVCDESKLVKNEVEIAVQINSKVKARVSVPAGLTADKLGEYALSLDAVKALVGGGAVKKVIAVPGRLVNIIV